MPFFPSLGDKDNVPDAFAKFNTGIERPILELHEVVMRGEDSPFTIAQRELIATFVSGTNACGYCTGAHNAAAMEYGVDEVLVVSLIKDIDGAAVEDKMKPVLKYVQKLTLTPTHMVQADADVVFAAGWSERALYDAIIICCAFNFMNRFVEGVGLSVIPEQFARQGKRLKDGYTKMADTFGLK